MLLNIIIRLAQNTECSNKSIASELGVDESLIEQMIGQLQCLGYIEKDNIDNLVSSHDCSYGSI